MSSIWDRLIFGSADKSSSEAVIYRTYIQFRGKFSNFRCMHLGTVHAYQIYRYLYVINWVVNVEPSLSRLRCPAHRAEGAQFQIAGG